LSTNSGCDILVVTFFGRGMVLCDRFDIDLDVVAEEDDKESDEKISHSIVLSLLRCRSRSKGFGKQQG